jgi:hypothetical protein
MRESFIAAAAAIFATLAPARADQITGTIMAVDPILHQFMLSDGVVYGLAKSVPASRLTIGSKVKVTYTSSDGTNTATAVTPVK